MRAMRTVGDECRGERAWPEPNADTGTRAIGAPLLPVHGSLGDDKCVPEGDGADAHPAGTGVRTALRTPPDCPMALITSAVTSVCARYVVMEGEVVEGGGVYIGNRQRVA